MTVHETSSEGRRPEKELKGSSRFKVSETARQKNWSRIQIERPVARSPLHTSFETPFGPGCTRAVRQGAKNTFRQIVLRAVHFDR